MTPTETLDALTALSLAHQLDYAPITVTWAQLSSLVADSRALRELVEALPKCHDCDRKATFVWRGLKIRHRCDTHVPNAMAMWDELPTAAVTRGLGL